MNAAYHLDSYRRHLATEVVSVRDEGLGVVLADTVLYPTGGGQPHDVGRLVFDGREITVTAVRSEGGTIVHELAEPWNEARGSAEVHLDWARRFDHMQQHTAQHVLSALAEDRHGWKTTAFHLGEAVCDVEIAVAGLKARQLDELEEEVNEVLRSALPVTDRWVSPEDLAGLEVRSRGLPDGHEGLVRLVEIDGIDLNTCGGTHLASTAEAETLKLLGREEMRGGTRLFWVAGRRVRARLGERETLLTGLRGVLEGADDELESLAAKKKRQVQSLQKEVRSAGELLVESWVEGALAADTEIVAQSVDPLGGEAVSRVARGFAARSSEASAVRCVVIASSSGPWAVAVAEDLDAQSFGRKLCDELGARGGGRGTVFQGKSDLGAAEFLERAISSLELLGD
ncbi:MAG: alanyl-tRNA editing protein [Acidobacteriota bacterium]